MFPFGKKKQLLDDDDQDRIVTAIRAAEAGTTGELRVFMESRCEYVDAMDRAKEVFVKLGMSNTERRNAVLVYMALEDHQYAIMGDKEIYEQAGGHLFWDLLSALMSWVRHWPNTSPTTPRSIEMNYLTK